MDRNIIAAEKKLGYNVSVCDECGHTVTHSCSCRNRSCPNCQSVLKEVWIEKRRSEVLDAKYFHMVFTAPHQLNALFISNQRLLFELQGASAVHRQIFCRYAEGYDHFRDPRH